MGGSADSSKVNLIEQSPSFAQAKQEEKASQEFTPGKAAGGAKQFKSVSKEFGGASFASKRSPASITATRKIVSHQSSQGSLPESSHKSSSQMQTMKRGV